MRTQHKLNYGHAINGVEELVETEWKIGRLVEGDDIAVMLRRLCRTSRRVGIFDGRPTRTCHIHVRAFKLAAPARRGRISKSIKPRLPVQQVISTAIHGGALNRRVQRKLTYLLRQGSEAGRGDLGPTGGTPPAELTRITQALAHTSRRRDANLLHEIVFELPAATDVETWVKCAEALGALFAKINCPSLYAIHISHNPHVHFLVAARPCRQTAFGDWIGEPQGRKGAPGFRLFASPDHIKAFRHRVCALVNAYCKPLVRFHPGRRAETDLAGLPEKRLKPSALLPYRIEMGWAFLEAVSRLKSRNVISAARVEPRHARSRAESEASEAAPEILHLGYAPQPSARPQEHRPEGLRSALTRPKSTDGTAAPPVRNPLQRPPSTMPTSPNIDPKPAQGSMPPTGGIERPVASQSIASSKTVLEQLLEEAKCLAFDKARQTEVAFTQSLKVLSSGKICTAINSANEVLEYFSKQDRTQIESEAAAYLARLKAGLAYAPLLLQQRNADEMHRQTLARRARTKDNKER
jgi:hypothetical protein